MAADRTLIEGTYRAAMADSRGSKHLARAGAISGVAQGLTGMAVGYLNQKTEDRKYYDGLAQKVLDEAGDLPQAEISALYDELQFGRQDYVWGDKKAKTLSLNNLNKKQEQYEEYSDIRESLADASLASNADGFSEYFKQSEKGKAYMSLLEDGSRLVPKKCPEGVECQGEGDMGVMIPNYEKLREANEMLDRMNDPYDELYNLPDAEWEEMAAEYDAIIEAEGNEWTSIASIKQEIDSNLVDKTFKDSLNGLLDMNTQMSVNVAEGQKAVFPRKFNENKIKSFLAKSNKKSVAYDKMFGDTSFHEDLVTKLTDPEFGGWETLGVDVTLLDPNTDGDPDVISPEDADFIAKTLIEDEQYDNFLTEEMVTYFTGFAEQNYGDAEELRVETSDDYILNKGGTRTRRTEEQQLSDMSFNSNAG